MSDQGKWWKLWLSALDDDDLENLSIHEWFAWARLACHIKGHGKNGRIVLRKPGTRVVQLMRVEDFDSAINMIKRFPNVEFETPQNETVRETVEYIVKFKNWNKYSGDYSYERVKKFRKNETVEDSQNETRQEEKRGEEKRRVFIPPTIPEVLQFCKSQGFHVDAEKFVNHYAARGWQFKRGQPMKDWKAAVRTWTRSEFNQENSKDPQWMSQ